MASIKIKSLQKLPLVKLLFCLRAHFKRNFRKQGFYKGRLFIPWKRKKKDDGKRILNSGLYKEVLRLLGAILIALLLVLLLTTQAFTIKVLKAFRKSEHLLGIISEKLRAAARVGLLLKK